MGSRAGDWLRQAERDLEHARRDAEEGFFEWACFSTHQAAEKAVKALFQARHGEARGHSVMRLLQSLPGEEQRPEGLIEAGMRLDRL